MVECHYALEFTNTSLVDLGEIKVEYCIFYRQGERSGATIHYGEGTCYGIEKWKALAAAKSVKLKSKPIKLYSAAGSATIFGRAEFSDADIRGIWIRLATKLPSGQEMVREYRSGDEGNFTWKWVPRSIGVGLNKSDSAFKIIVIP